MKYYRLLAMLPPLPSAPTAPPVTLAEVAQWTLDELSGAAREEALAILGLLDCRNTEALLMGRQSFDSRAPHTLEQLVERQDLPDWLTDYLVRWDSGVRGDANPTDALWRAYFSHLEALGQKSKGSFLSAWAGFEISLRDALARLRAEKLGDKGETRVSGVQPDEGVDHTSLLSMAAEAQASSDPLDGERKLDAARLQFIEANNGIDPFSTDAALSYLAAILILDRWDVGDEADVAKILEVFA